MRFVGFVFAAVLGLGASLAGCKGKSDASAAPDPAALQAQQDLVSRRDALMAERQKLQSEKAQIEIQIQEGQAKGIDTSELASRRDQIESAIKGQSTDLDSISGKLDQVVAAQGDVAGRVAARESSVATREQRFAEREAAIAARERDIAARERAAAVREQAECGAGAQPMIIQQVAAPAKPGGYTRKEIDPILARARNAMRSKGLVSADLGPGSSLDGEATRAMGDGDYGKAYLAATQLLATVEQLRIDRQFITLKYKRINERFSASKLDGTAKAKLEKELQDVVQLYGDGDHGAANKKLNAVASQLK